MLRAGPEGRRRPVLRSRGSLTAIAAVAVVGLVTASPGLAAHGSSPDPSEGRKVDGGPPLPASGALFGAYVANTAGSGLTNEDSFENFEDLTGRGMVLDRVYYNWDAVFPGEFDYASRAHGRTLALSWNASHGDGSFAKWKDISRGLYDSVIDVRATDIKAFGAPIFFTFNHEPENDGRAGTSADFVAAWKHIHDRFVADGVTNVSYVLVLMAYSYRIGTADPWYPGRNYVDLVAADGYNWNGCPGRDDPWNTFDFVFGAFHDWGIAKGKPEMIAEWGSNEDDQIPGRKAGWITDASATLKSWPEVKALTYYENGPPYAICDWNITSSTTATAAFSRMGRDPYFEATTSVWPPDGAAAYVSASDEGFSAPVGDMVQGGKLKWVFLGPGSHTASDNSGMGLFDSGTKAAGTSYTFSFVCSANYTYKDRFNGSHTQTIKVPLAVAPSAGKVTTPFTVTFCSGLPPVGYVMNIQVKRPRSGGFTNWLTDQAVKSAVFIPDAGKGTYSFRAELKKLVGGASSGYSVPVSIQVTALFGPSSGGGPASVGSPGLPAHPPNFS